MPSRKYHATKTEWSPADQVKAQEGFADIAFCLLLGSEIAHGQIRSDFTADDLLYLNNILIKRGFISVKDHLNKSFSFVAHLLFDLLTKKVTT